MDFIQVKKQLEAYYKSTRETAGQWLETRNRLANFYQKSSHESGKWIEAIETLAEQWAEKRPSLLLARFVEEPGQFLSLAPLSKQASLCLATDGSQVFPSRHELPQLALIQTGRVRIGYYCDIQPRLDAVPRLLTTLDWQSAIEDSLARPTFEDFVKDERTLDELTRLGAMMEEHLDFQFPKAALVDGSLIYWWLGGRSEAWRSRVIHRLEKELNRFRERNFPLLGYISRPGSREVVQSLSVFYFLEKEGRLPAGPAQLVAEDFLQGLPLTDEMLFDLLLQPGQRSPWMLSCSYILKEFSEENRTAFCYLKTEGETARIEIPTWAMPFSDSFLPLVREQCRKGRGYPIVLAEAHDQAVIRAQDRQLFYRMALEEQRQITGCSVSLEPASPKQQRKKRPLF
jgi:hypothetical protein